MDVHFMCPVVYAGLQETKLHCMKCVTSAMAITVINELAHVFFSLLGSWQNCEG